MEEEIHSYQEFIKETIKYLNDEEISKLAKNEMGVTPSRVRNLRIQDIIRDTIVDGPVPEISEQIRQLHRQFHVRKS